MTKVRIQALQILTHPKLFLLLCFCFLAEKLIGQSENFVPNGDFDVLRGCPTSLDQLRLTGNWMSFGTGDPSPDVYHACANPGSMGVPANLFGYQPAKEGKGYAGLITYLTSKSGKSWKMKSNHREFLVTHLLKPLEQGKEYYVEISVSLAENCEFAVGNLGMLLSDKIPAIEWMPIEFGYFKPQIKNDPTNMLSSTDDWMKISGTFTAAGGEKILTIGNFDNDKVTQKAKNGKGKNVFYDGMKVPKKIRPIISYYFIDDVVVRAVQPDITPTVRVTPSDTIPIVTSSYFGEIGLGKKIVLENIYFDFNESTLLESSYSELDQLVSLLLENDTLKISITGHTDDVGTEAYNLQLSAKRAKAVVVYLISKGINEERLTDKGEGSSQPKVSNATEEGRAINRRVEFEIINE